MLRSSSTLLLGLLLGSLPLSCGAPPERPPPTGLLGWPHGSTDEDNDNESEATGAGISNCPHGPLNGDDECEPEPSCTEGEIRECVVELGTHGQITTCWVGVERCTKGHWGPCSEGEPT